jgi:2'-deoxynucleoside 5'-phosphate N-hydrolase
VRIYLACTVRGSRAGVVAARVAAARLEALGHEVLTSHLLREDVEQAESALSEREVFERDVSWLDSCDAIVAEASGSSYGVGFEVGYLTGRAARTGQRVYLLYAAQARGVVSRLVSGYASRHGEVLEYRSPDEVEAFIARVFPAAGPAIPPRGPRPPAP